MTRLGTMVTVLALLTTRLVSADVIETSSSRFIVVMNQGGDVIDGPTQVDFASTQGLFDEVVQSSAWNEFHGGSSEALQDSDVTHGVYRVHLEVGTDADGGTMGTDIATGYAESSFELLFTLTEATDFNIAGTYNSFGEINGAVSEVEIRIDSLGGGTPSQVIAYATDNCCPSTNVDGTLLPGAYALRAHVLAIVDQSFMTSYTTSTSGTNFTMTLDVPQPNPLGDMNCSGVVNVDDVAAFVQAVLDPSGYENTHPNCDRNLADVNGDNLIDGADVSAFSRCALLAECP
ncbi:MAG: hypothetical protein H6818_05765 [Phycisphaerales bacterium]|nr:hypothetical protein [Phycisphaerales bacterium]MCB9862769.1 hypothetical protein [Phycisphaerales bacterium]